MFLKYPIFKGFENGVDCVLTASVINLSGNKKLPSKVNKFNKMDEIISNRWGEQQTKNSRTSDISLARAQVYYDTTVDDYIRIHLMYHENVWKFLALKIQMRKIEIWRKSDPCCFGQGLLF